MTPRLQTLAVAFAATLLAGVASAQSNVVQVGVTDYTTHAKTNGITGIGVPPGADAEIGNATTVIFTYERLFTPNIGVDYGPRLPSTKASRSTRKATPSSSRSPVHRTPSLLL